MPPTASLIVNVGTYNWIKDGFLAVEDIKTGLLGYPGGRRPDEQDKEERKGKKERRRDCYGE